MGIWLADADILIDMMQVCGALNVINANSPWCLLQSTSLSLFYSLCWFALLFYSISPQNFN